MAPSRLLVREAKRLAATLGGKSAEEVLAGVRARVGTADAAKGLAQGALGHLAGLLERTQIEFAHDDEDRLTGKELARVLFQDGAETDDAQEEHSGDDSDSPKDGEDEAPAWAKQLLAGVQLLGKRVGRLEREESASKRRRGNAPASGLNTLPAVR